MQRAYVYHRFGGPENESFADVPRPVPGPGQLLVAVRAAGVNPADWKRREGIRGPNEPVPDLPAVFGREVAGVVAETGPDTPGFAPGDEVFGHPLTGGYAQYTLLAVGGAAHKPAGVSWTDAAVLPVAAGTAIDALRQLALPKGATLLVNGAGGGVGTAAVQLAVHEGLTVIGTASESKRDFVTSLGAVHVASGDQVADRVRAVAPDGVDAVLDLAGGAALRAVAELAADRSKVLSAGAKALVVELGGAQVARRRTSEVLDEVAALVAAGVLDPNVTRTYPFEEADRALRAVEDGHTRGKVVLTFSEEQASG